MFYDTYDFGDDGGTPSSYVDSVIAKAGERAKRKRQEESFRQRKEQQEEAKKRKDKHRRKSKAHEVRDETLEERNSRKLAAKLARNKNKGKEKGGKGAESVITQEQLVEALAVRDSNGVNEVETPLEEHRVNLSDGDDDDEQAESLKSSKVEATETEEMDEEEENGGKANEEVPSFYKELNFAHEKNLEVKVAQRFEDEDDARMEIDSQRLIAPETAPIPLKDSVQEWGLDEKLRENLEKMEVDQFFPVQRSVIPSVVRDNAADYLIPRDMCISAPTGSGKTLAYVVPIVHTLMKRDITQLSAVVLLPSRELAVQVHKVFESVARGTRVQSTITTGQRSFEQEQEALVGKNISHPYNPLTKVSASSFTPCYKRDEGPLGLGALLRVCPGQAGRSEVDVLVCTPGRLLDHLEYTSGFTLQHVRFLVLDEADRLLNNSYHNWVRDLVSSIDSLPGTGTGTGTGTGANTSASYGRNKGEGDIPDTSSAKAKMALLHSRPPAPLQRLLFSATLTDNPAKLALLNVMDPLILRCAAADHAAGIGGNEEGKSGEEKEGGVAFTLPAGLSEAMAVCTTAKRPFILACLLAEAFDKVASNTSSVGPASRGDDVDESKENETEAEAEGGSAALPQSNRPQLTKAHQVCGARSDGGVAIVFTTSVDTTHRLSTLLCLLNGQSVAHIARGSNPTGDSQEEARSRKGLYFGGAVVEMSSNVPAEERDRLMTAAARGYVSIIVATDNLARGIDLPNLRLVVNYDPPQQSRTYVHRVGRTARAGCSGTALTMLKSGQVGAFRKIRSQIDGGAIVSTPHVGTPERLPRCKPTKQTEEEVMPRFTKAIKCLAAALGLQAATHVDIGE